jgi:uncharacterized protein
MIGTLINAGAILFGSIIGVMLSKGIPARMRECCMQGMGLCIILIGIQGAVKTANTLCVIVCMAIGGLIGCAINIERQMERLGNFAEKKLSHSGGVANAFVTAALVFCVGAMAIIGAMDSGLRGDHSTLIAKALLDGVISVFLASSLGIGVALSAVAVLVYQGAIALLASWISPLLTDEIINEMSAVGGLLIIGVGLNMIYDKHISVGNLLPAIFLPMAYIPLTSLF